MSASSSSWVTPSGRAVPTSATSVLGVMMNLLFVFSCASCPAMGSAGRRGKHSTRSLRARDGDSPVRPEADPGWHILALLDSVAYLLMDAAHDELRSGHFVHHRPLLEILLRRLLVD